MRTTIKLKPSTKKRLDRFREHKAESYDEILNKLAHIAENAADEPEISKEAAKAIRDARRRVLEGRYASEAEAKERLGL